MGDPGIHKFEKGGSGSRDPGDPGIQINLRDPDPGIHKFEKGGSGSRDPGDPGIQINLGDPGIQGIQGSSRWIPDPEIKSHKSDFK